MRTATTIVDFGRDEKIDISAFGITAEEALAAAENVQFEGTRDGFAGTRESAKISLDGTEITLFSFDADNLTEDNFIVDDAVA